MKPTRRNFLKSLAGLAAGVAAGVNLPKSANEPAEAVEFLQEPEVAQADYFGGTCGTLVYYGTAGEDLLEGGPVYYLGSVGLVGNLPSGLKKDPLPFKPTDGAEAIDIFREFFTED